MLLSETQSSQYNIESLRAQQKNTSCFMPKNIRPQKQPPPVSRTNVFIFFKFFLSSFHKCIPHVYLTSILRGAIITKTRLLALVAGECYQIFITVKVH